MGTKPTVHSAQPHAPGHLTLPDAEATVAELEAALDAHRSWIKRFQTLLVCRSIEDPDDLAPDRHRSGDFGRWYRETRNETIRGHPEFPVVGRLHEEMHRIAHGLAERVRDGRPIPREAYGEFVVAVDRFKLGVRRILVEGRELLRAIDPLTGVANRFVMLPRLEQERERVERSGDESCLGMMDLDHFKRVNDTYGHHEGDRVLKAVAGYLLGHLRRYDEFYRYGGEEFLILLPDTAPARAKRVLDRLRRGLAGKKIGLGDGTEIHVTASFGIAPLRPELPVKTAVERADQAMYAAKDAGRNRVRVWEGDTAAPVPG